MDTQPSNSTRELQEAFDTLFENLSRLYKEFKEFTKEGDFGKEGPRSRNYAKENQNGLTSKGNSM